MKKWLLCFFSVFFLFSCAKDIDVFTPYGNGIEVFSTDKSSLTEFAVNTTTEQTIHLADGIQLIIPPNAFLNESGLPAEQEVFVYATVAGTVLSFVRHNLDFQQDQTALSLPTAIYFNFIDNQGNNVSIDPANPLTLQIEANAVDVGVNRAYFRTLADWEVVESFTTTTILGNSEGIASSTLGWKMEIAKDTWYAVGRQEEKRPQLQEHCVQLENIYSDANAIVFATNSERGLYKRYYYDSEKFLFCDKFSERTEIEGWEIVAITYDSREEAYFFGTKNALNKAEDVAISLQPKSVEEILQYLESL